MIYSGRLTERDRQSATDSGRLNRRLRRVQAEWPTLAGRLAKGLRTAAQIRADLAAAGCPVSFAEIGASAPRAREAVLWSKDIRARYTILHFCWDVGRLEAWADEALAPVL